MVSDINELLTIVADAEKHLSSIARMKVTISLSFEPDEFYERGFAFLKPENKECNLLLDIVSMNFGVPTVLVRSKKRAHAEARWAFSVIARKHVGWTLTQIGDFLKRDHTTIVHGISSAEALMETPNEYFAIKMKKIETDFLNTKTKE